MIIINQALLLFIYPRVLYFLVCVLFGFHDNIMFLEEQIKKSLENRCLLFFGVYFCGIFFQIFWESKKKILQK